MTARVPRPPRALLEDLKNAARSHDAAALFHALVLLEERTSSRDNAGTCAALVAEELARLLAASTGRLTNPLPAGPSTLASYAVEIGELAELVARTAKHLATLAVEPGMAGDSAEGPQPAAP